MQEDEEQALRRYEENVAVLARRQNDVQDITGLNEQLLHRHEENAIYLNLVQKQDSILRRYEENDTNRNSRQESIQEITKQNEYLLHIHKKNTAVLDLLQQDIQEHTELNDQLASLHPSILARVEQSARDLSSSTETMAVRILAWVWLITSLAVSAMGYLICFVLVTLLIIDYNECTILDLPFSRNLQNQELRWPF